MSLHGTPTSPALTLLHLPLLGPHPHYRFADRLGMGMAFDFEQDDMANLRRKICYRLCSCKVTPMLPL